MSHNKRYKRNEDNNMMKKNIHFFWLLTFVMIGCDQKSDNEFDDSSSWRSIQTRILTPKCANCHVAGSSFAEQSGLVLTEDVGYAETVSQQVKNAAAQKDGLEMVGTQGLPSVYKSFFWEKINYPDEDHFYNDHPNYGSLMPLGGDPLTNGELELIRQWIVAGAPKEGKVVDLKVLEDTRRYERPAFRPLEKPEQGYQLKLGPFEVAPNFNREFFVYQQVGNPTDVYVKRMEIEMRSGSHHFLIYNFRANTPSSVMPKEGLVRDIWDANGGFLMQNAIAMQYHTFFGGTQWPRLNYTFPEGVALKMPANSGFDLNSHYVNRSKEKIVGEVYANLHTVDKSQVKYEAGILDLNNTNIFLPPNQKTTLQKSFTFNKQTRIAMLFSHAHQLMSEFKVFVEGGVNNGKMIYYADDWEHPPILTFNDPLVLEAGTKLRLEATYNNNTNRAVSFGLTADDEMMILFGYYY